MFAVIEIGGSQQKVAKNDLIDVNRLDAKEGDTIVIDSVVLLGESDDKAKIGQPYVEGAKVKAKVVKHFRGEKIIVFKFKAKKRYQKTQGHRQDLTKLEILDITG